MFRKTKRYRAVNQLWEDLFIIKLGERPIKGEWIFYNNSYHMVIEVIHQEDKNTILVIKKIENEKSEEESGAELGIKLKEDAKEQFKNFINNG